MKALTALIKRDLYFFFFRKGSFFNILSMFLILAFLLSNLLPNNTITYISILLLVVHIITTITFAHYIFQDDYQDSSLDQLRSSGHRILVIIVAKLLSYWLLNLLVLLVGMLIYLLIYSYSVTDFIFPAIVLIITSIISTSVSMFVSILTIAVDRSGILNILIGTPLLIAFFLYSTFLINSNTDIKNITFLFAQLKILIGFCLIILPVSVFACSRALSEIQCKS